MPASVVQNDDDEQAWSAAKEMAAKRIKTASRYYWPTVMAVYKKLTHRESLSSTQMIRLMTESGMSADQLVEGLLD